MDGGISKRVLVVEDDPTMLAFWDRLLMKLGVTQRVLLTSAVQAKNLLDRSDFDLLISDIIMPHINGYELARHAREKKSGIDIVLTTAYNTDLSRFDLEGLRLHLIHKPYIDLGGLSTMLTHLLHGEDVFEDAEEDSWSDNEDYPEVTEWKL
jgi:CheY-like chemotaxis protein